MMSKKFFIVLSLFMFFTGCFGGGLQKAGSVQDYSDGLVKTKGGAFRIASLPSYWHKQDIDYRAVLLLNSLDHSTITIDSWCKRAADDGSLKSLTKDLLRGIQELKVKQTYTYNTAKRAALLTEANGQMDGRNIFVSTYVFKMNACVFDFVYVSLPDELEYYSDFKKMIEGFVFIKGPKLL